MLTKEQILAALDLKTQPLTVPGLNVQLFIRTMSGRDRCEYVDLVRDKNESAPYYAAALAAVTLVDDAGNRLFTGDDIDALQAMPWTSLDAIAEASAELNGFNKKDEPAPVAVATA